ncbi:MAG: hypothetical protein JXB25_07135 [Deltaproteobacteria bacterium]|nr:hypothetical protein [Deltaproteobacteria bacterium]
MEHLDFIVWMIGFPIAEQICSAILKVANKYAEIEPRTYSKHTDGMAAAIFVAIWLYVGCILF